MNYNETLIKDFAIYVCCYSGDYHLAKILCESIRYFCGDIPIFLIKDGNFSTLQICKLGNINEFKEPDIPVQLKGLRGWGLRKLYAFFQKDYERFLYLDSDIVLIQNPFVIPFQKYDFYVDTSGFKDLDGLLPGIRFRGKFPLAAAPYTFNPIKLIHFDPNFDLQNVLLFNSGHIFGKSGLIDADLVKECVDELYKGGNLFFWDGGILNYLLNKGHQEGCFTLGGERFRILGSDPPEKWPKLTIKAVLEKNFHDRVLIHWAGPSKRGREIPYGSILEAFRTLYYRRFHPLAYPLDEAQRALATRCRGLARRLKSAASALYLHH
jgi:hypothetical protein